MFRDIIARSSHMTINKSFGKSAIQNQNNNYLQTGANADPN